MRLGGLLTSTGSRPSSCARVLDDLHLSLEAVDDGDDLVWVAVDNEADNLLPGDHLKLEGARRGDAHCWMRCSGKAPRTLPSIFTSFRPPLLTYTSSSALRLPARGVGGGFAGMRLTTRKPRDATTVRATLAWSTCAGTRLSNPSGAP